MLTFDRNRKRVKQCPCGKSNSDGKFIPYTNCTVHGYCYACAQSFKPAMPNNAISAQPVAPPPPARLPLFNQLPPAHRAIIDDAYVQSHRQYYQSNFASAFAGQISCEALQTIHNLYRIGRHNNYTGANVFWYLDENAHPLTGKIMVYHNNLKRNRQIAPNWIHCLLKTNYIKTGFFGQHLLNWYPNKPVAIVESEKTACIASVKIPGYIWLASGGAANLTYPKMQSLKGRRILLVPDVDAMQLWKQTAEQYKLYGHHISVTNFFESEFIQTKLPTTGKEDIADYLLKM